MKTLHTFKKDRFIAYNLNKSNNKNAPYVIFLHGLMSNMEGIKATSLEKQCQHIGLSYIRFDNFGHGNSSGSFESETIGSWLKGLELIVNELVGSSKVILVGSSMGAWISLLYAVRYPQKMAGLVCIAPATDFTEEIIWNKLSYSEQQEMVQHGVLNIMGHEGSCSYPISYSLILEAHNHLLMNKDCIQINCPVHLIHGMQDAEVHYTQSLRILEKLQTNTCILKLIKDGDHRLSKPDEISLIFDSIKTISNHSYV